MLSIMLNKVKPINECTDKALVIDNFCSDQIRNHSFTKFYLLCHSTLY